MATYGAAELVAGPSKAIAAKGAGALKVPVSEFIDGMGVEAEAGAETEGAKSGEMKSRYSFDGGFVSRHPRLLQDTLLPAAIFGTPNSPHSSNSGAGMLQPLVAQLSIGGSKTGLSFHDHTAAFSALVYGRKRWLLLRPYVDSGTQQQYWHGNQSDAGVGAGTTNASGELKQCFDVVWRNLLQFARKGGGKLKGVDEAEAYPTWRWISDVYPWVSASSLDGATGDEALASILKRVKVPKGVQQRQGGGDTADGVLRMRTLEHLGLDECVQEAGEAIWVPQSYHHAVLNLGHTVSLAFREDFAHPVIACAFLLLLHSPPPPAAAAAAAAAASIMAAASNVECA
jgi:hypothetical protein